MDFTAQRAFDESILLITRLFLLQAVEEDTENHLEDPRFESTIDWSHWVTRGSPMAGVSVPFSLVVFVHTLAAAE